MRHGKVNHDKMRSDFSKKWIAYPPEEMVCFAVRIKASCSTGWPQGDQLRFGPLSETTKMCV